MGSQIDEFLAKKKEQTTLLDLHNCTANSKEELRKLVEKVPEFKIKPEKKPDDIKIREKKFKFKLSKKEIKKPFPFAEPTPSEMKGVSLEELYSINQNIPWKMLTSLRPKSKIDEEYFSRQIELGTATLKTRGAEKRNAPRDGYLRKRKNASGGVEARFPSCKECGVEFCAGDGCNAFDYDSFKRRVAAAATVAATQNASGGDGGGGDHAQAGGQEHGDGPAKRTTKKKNAAAGRGGTTTAAAAAAAAAQRAKGTARNGVAVKTIGGKTTGAEAAGAKATGGKAAATTSRPAAPPGPAESRTGDARAAARKAAAANDRGRGARKPSDKK